MKKLILLSFSIALAVGCTHTNNSSDNSLPPRATATDAGPHILLISVDGMHAVDLSNYIQQNPKSTLASLSAKGTTYTNAMTTSPSDSFPGTASMITGASPATTGIYYDVSYDRALSPPNSDCATIGTTVSYDESIDLNPNALDAGGGIDPTKLPLDPKKGCTPVYPHDFIRVNTMFEVVKQHGGVTAWSDKHPSYDFMNGPSGQGVDDLYNPEINGDVDNVPGTTGSEEATQVYDSIKVRAILNQIQGYDHAGGGMIPGTPILFGMNFQAVSVAQKLDGYKNKDGKVTLSDGVSGAIDFVDQSLKQMITNLKARHLMGNTTIIITAKHGQAAMDPSQRKIISDKLVPLMINTLSKDLVAQATLDDIGLIYLNDRSQTGAVATLMTQNAALLGIQQVYSAEQLNQAFGMSNADSRAPDLILQTVPGVIYASPSASKYAEHGGMSDDDRHVALLVVSPDAQAGATIEAPVDLKQIAPTVLSVLGIDPAELQGAKAESTEPLPVQ